MNEWFTELEPRERIFVAAAGVTVIIALFWFALWMPLEESERDLSARIGNWQSSLSELRPLRGRLQAGGNQPLAANPDQSLVVIVDNTLRSRNLYSALQRSNPTNNNDGIRVDLENVAFDDLVLWIGEMGSQYGLQVQTATFTRSQGNDRGRVSASVTLER
jgi:general secretion pathway protein M